MIDPNLIPLVAQRFKALGEPARLELLAVLQQGEKSVSELVAATGRTQPNVSQHLKEMAHAGIVAQRREGNRVYYGITDPYVNRICDAVCQSVRGVQGPERSRAAGRTHPRRTPADRTFRSSRQEGNRG